MRPLRQDEIDYLLTIKHEHVTTSLLKSLFARTLKHPVAKFKTTDYFILPENTCANNIQGVTTVGAYVVNRLLIDKHFGNVTGYVNMPITNKCLGTIYELISDALFEEQIKSQDFFEFIDTLEFLGGGDLCELLNVSISNQMFILPKVVKDRRDELFKQYAKEIAAGDVNIGAKIETELVNLAKKEMQKLPEWDNYASGSKLNFGNNYKTVMIMKGPILNTGTNEWTIATSNYDTGIRKDEYAMFADSAVYGTYQRAIGVAIGGYNVKKFISTLQDIVTGPILSDCKTNGYLNVVIDPYFKKNLLYRYIIEGTKLVQLTRKNFDSYVGKTVKMRSPMYCHYKAPALCNKCVGEHPYKLNLKNIGLAATKMGSTLLNKRLKAFHNKKVSIYEITIEDLIEN